LRCLLRPVEVACRCQKTYKCPSQICFCSHAHDSRGVSPGRSRLPAGPQYVRRSQLSCTGPPQIGFNFAAPGEDTLSAAREDRLEELRLVAAANGGKAHVMQTDLEREKRSEELRLVAASNGPRQADRSSSEAHAKQTDLDAAREELEELRLKVETLRLEVETLRADRLEAETLRADLEARLLEVPPNPWMHPVPLPPSWMECPPSLAWIQNWFQSRPDHGLEVQAKVRTIFLDVPSSLGSGQQDSLCFSTSV